MLQIINNLTINVCGPKLVSFGSLLTIFVFHFRYEIRHFEEGKIRQFTVDDVTFDDKVPTLKTTLTNVFSIATNEAPDE